MKLIKRKVLTLSDRILKGLDILLSSIYQSKYDKLTYNDLRPIFIVGVPRSGTTFISQIVFDLLLHKSYLSNFDNLFPRSKFISTFFKRRMPTKGFINSMSNYGKFKGLNSLSEGGNVWNYLCEDEVHSISKLRSYVIQQCILQKSIYFLNKNTYHIYRLDVLHRSFPNAFFIVVRRSPLDTALSLLKARSTYLKNENLWFGLKPVEFNELKHLTPAEQCMGQVYHLNNALHRGIEVANIPKENITYVDYEDALSSGTQMKDKFSSVLVTSLKNWDEQIELRKNRTVLASRKKVNNNLYPERILLAHKKFYASSYR